MKRNNAGRYVRVSTIGETVKAYIPAPLPPVPLPELSGRRALLYAEAMSVGRLLIQMMLCRSGLLKKPLLYLSLYFKQHRQEYYRLLGSIREEGNWEAWIDYFLEAVGSTARQAISALTHLHGRMAQDKAWADSLGRTRSTALKLLAVLQSSIVARPLVLAEQAGISPATTYKLLDAMEQQGIVTRNSTAPRNRVYTYTPYADMLRDK